MKRALLLTPVLTLTTLLLGSCSHAPTAATDLKPGALEKHFKSLRQLTFEGTNAEAYFSPDGKKLIYQGHTREQGCDQVYTMDLDGSNKKLISVNHGRNTCSYFLDNAHVLFSSTFAAGAGCPKERDKSKGYVWDIFKSYEIYTANADGSDAKPLTHVEGYDAESTVCGGKVVFTSAREGHSLDIYIMKSDGSGMKRLTSEVGYNGGPFFSADCSKIVYRAVHPRGKGALRAFKKAVAEGYVPPGPLELYVMNADGSGKHRITNYGAASFAPSFYPKGDRVIFSSNRAPSADGGPSLPGRVFRLWAVAASGDQADAPEAITTEGKFNGFPMFSPDGKHLAFASDRNSARPHELNIFLAEWQD